MSTQNPGNCENGGRWVVDPDGKDVPSLNNGDDGYSAGTYGPTGVLDAGSGGTFRLQAATISQSCTVSKPVDTNSGARVNRRRHIR